MSGIVYEIKGGTSRITGKEQWVATRHWGRSDRRGPKMFDTRAQAEAWAIPPRLRES